MAVERIVLDRQGKLKEYAKENTLKSLPAILLILEEIRKKHEESAKKIIEEKTQKKMTDFVKKGDLKDLFSKAKNDIESRFERFLEEKGNETVNSITQEKVTALFNNMTTGILNFLNLKIAQRLIDQLPSLTPQQQLLELYKLRRFLINDSSDKLRSRIDVILMNTYHILIINHSLALKFKST